MERKLIITRWKEQVLTSLLENGEIVEFHCSPNETKEQAVLGNIYVQNMERIQKAAAAPTMRNVVTEIGENS